MVIHTEAKRVCQVRVDNKLYKGSEPLQQHWKSVYGVDKQCKSESLLHSAFLQVRSKNNLTDIKVSHYWGSVCLNAVKTAGRSKT